MYYTKVCMSLCNFIGQSLAAKESFRSAAAAAGVSWGIMQRRGGITEISEEEQERDTFTDLRRGK